MKEEEGDIAIAIAMKMARELAAVSKQKKKKYDEHVEQLQRRRMEITTLLQHCGTSISALQSLSIQESRHEENCLAIPEGNENEEEDEDEDEDNDCDNDDSVVKLSSKTLTLDQDDSESDSNSNTDSECNCDIEKGTVKQTEQQRQRRNNVFHRMKRRFVVAKSFIVAKSA